MTKTKVRTTKILPRHHTGRIRHHKHTSYGSLAIVLLLAFIPLVMASHSVAVADAYQTYAVVPGPTPKVAPSITNQTNGTVYKTSAPVLIKGYCPANTLVKVFKNEVLAGAALCQNGAYQLSIDLFIGNNSVIARAYNANDAVSPDSVPVSLQLLLPGSSLNGSSQLNTAGAPAGQFYLTSEVFYRGASVGDTLTWPLIISGGQAPYAVSISWGDGKTDLISRGDSGRFDISHVYSKAGGYKGSFTVVVKASDQTGNQSFLQLTAIISGGTPSAGLLSGTTTGYNRSSFIRLAWQMLAIAVVTVLSFWLGEKREAKLLRRLVGRAA